MKYFAIRHIPTGKLMPAAIFRSNSRGYSHWEPTGIAGLGGCTEAPRLFPSLRAASISLVYWLKGPWGPRMKKADYSSWGEHEEYQAGIEPTTPENKIPRIPSDMEIIAFNLVEIQK